jgi:hypothetical protein
MGINVSQHHHEWRRFPRAFLTGTPVLVPLLEESGDDSFGGGQLILGPLEPEMERCETRFEVTHPFLGSLLGAAPTNQKPEWKPDNQTNPQRHWFKVHAIPHYIKTTSGDKRHSL